MVANARRAASRPLFAGLTSSMHARNCGPPKSRVTVTVKASMPASSNAAVKTGAGVAEGCHIDLDAPGDL